MTTEGFTAPLDVLEKCAVATLPNIAARLQPVTVKLAGPPSYDAGGAPNVHHAHSDFVREIVNRQRLMSDALDATAKVLLEIVELYRRADGQA